MAGLGSFNAWSVFRLPLSDLYGANVTDVNTALFISSLVFGLVASGSALLVGREGPRAVGVAGSLLYVFGVSLSGLAGDSLSTLYLTYGILAAAGLGLAVMAPIAALPAWFPQRPGFAYGVAFVGFGMGPLVNVPLMEWLLAATGGPLGTFHILGILYAAAVGGAAWFVRYPPKHAAIAASWRTGAGRGSPNRGRARLAFAGRPQDLAVVRPVGRVFSQHDRRACDPLGRQGDGRRDRRRLCGDVLPAGDVLLVDADAGGRVGAVFCYLCMVVMSCYGGGYGTISALAGAYYGARGAGTVDACIFGASAVASFGAPVLLARSVDLLGSYYPALYATAGLMGPGPSPRHRSARRQAGVDHAAPPEPSEQQARAWKPLSTRKPRGPAARTRTHGRSTIPAMIPRAAPPPRPGR